MARALPGILPEMSIDKALDSTYIYSVADQLPPETPLPRLSPFRASHNIISHIDQNHMPTLALEDPFTEFLLGSLLCEKAE